MQINDLYSASCNIRLKQHSTSALCAKKVIIKRGQLDIINIIYHSTTLYYTVLLTLDNNQM